MYVWFDALNIYQSGIGFGSDEERYRHWWPADVHLIGKGIIRFHAVYWPAFLFSAGLPLPKSLFVHGYLTVDGQKMSKTIGNIVDPFAVIRDYGAEALRYFILRDVPATGDGDFSIEKLRDRYNGDLANGLGNLVARVGALAEKAGPVFVPSAHALANAIIEARARRDELLAAYRFNDALGALWNLIGAADRYLNETKPWTLEGEELKRVIAPAAAVVLELAVLIEPFLPGTATKITSGITRDGDVLTMRKGEGLFPRLA